MPRLFDPARHEPLTATRWDPQRAQAAIQSIVADIEAQRRPDGTWPVHPQDDDAPPATGFNSFYLGTAGVLWMLWYLQREGAADVRLVPADLIDACADAYRANPDTGAVVPSYFLGEAFILLLQWRLTGAPAVADRLYACVEENIPNPTNEALWAAPGTMLAAWQMLQWTGETRWRDLFVANVEQLWRTWLPDAHAAGHLWTQDLYGRIVQLLGAGHGFAGNAFPLLQGAALLEPARRDALHARCTQAFSATALADGDGVNWAPGIATPASPQEKVLLQWCHGAPGIITSLAPFPVGISPVMEDLLLRGGATVWNAGPLVKGAGLCHGTAGNGYAFLALHRRTGDPAWLERARAFAMHAIEQVDAMRAVHARGRYTLWTGDPGVAVYLWHCIVGAGGLPGLDLVG